MTHWVRFSHRDVMSFGTLTGEEINIFEGDMFSDRRNTGRRIALADVELQAPCMPSKIVALWNNFHALAAKLGQPVPADPLYLLKAPSSVLRPGGVVKRPASYTGKIGYEGELGIVIGRTCCEIKADEADQFIFGYTCVNDITASDILNKDASFAQWARAKSFDGFGPFGPYITTGLEPEQLIVKTILNGAERQAYPVADMIFSTCEIVARLSHDMTLEPGDLICCGTSVGLGATRESRNEVVVEIASIGALRNTLEQ